MSVLKNTKIAERFKRRLQPLVRHYKLNLLELNLDDYIPMEIQMRFALEKMGMEFTDSGKAEAAFNRNPIPLGKTECYENFSEPMIRHYTQILPNTN